MQTKKSQNHNNMLEFLSINWPASIRILSFKHFMIELPEQIVQYLHQDQIFVSDQLKLNTVLGVDSGSLIDSSPRFMDLENIFAKIFAQFDDAVFIKYNWRAPMDCSNWLFDMKCKNLYDVLMSIKTSAIIMENLNDYNDWINVSQDQQLKLIKRNDPKSNVTKNCNFIIVRKWYELNPRREYRCFIKDKKIRGITQRNLYLINPLVELELEQLFQKIKEFYETKILLEFNLPQFVLDIYIDIPPIERIILVDINPWGEYTQPKLYEYEELESEQELDVVRVVKNQDEIRQEDLNHYRMPSEFSDFEDPSQMIELLQQICKQQND